MLKKSASGVLSSAKSSTYPKGYACGFDSPAALLDGLFEHPARETSTILDVQISNISACPQSFLQFE
jgi:hypothetical protein